MIPFQITFNDFPESDAVWLAVQKRVEKLEQFFKRIVRCEVVISCPHQHRHADRLFHVQVHVFIPGNDVIVNRGPAKREAHRDLYIAIRDSFNAAERILQDRVHIIRKQTKHHENQTSKRKVFPDSELEEQDLYSSEILPYQEKLQAF